MRNFEKPLNEFTENELQQKVNQWDPRFGALALYELQRRQQKLTTEQIASLSEEIKVLKEITGKSAETSIKNAQSDNRLARTAIIIAVVAILVQVAFSIHQKIDCRFSETGSGQKFTYYRDCQRTVDFGIFGTWHFKINDVSVPNE